MSNNNESRVLARKGARQLTPEEMEQIAGGGINTRASRTGTGSISSADTDMDS